MSDSQDGFSPRETHDIRMDAITSATSYGQNAIKGLFLINSGAAVAELTLVGSLYARTDQASASLASVLLSRMASSLSFLSAGLVCSILMSAFGYFSSIYLADALDDPAVDRKVGYARNGAIVFGFLSLASFLAGAWSFFRALKAASHLS